MPTEAEVDKATEVVFFQIAKLELAPGDVLVINGPQDWPAVYLQRFGEFIQNRLKTVIRGVRIVVLPYGATITKVTPPPQ